MCFTKLKLLLIAIEAKGDNGMDSYIAINPGQGARIQYATQGFFIAQSADEVKKGVAQNGNRKIRNKKRKLQKSWGDNLSLIRE